MKKILSDSLTLYFFKNFPRTFQKSNKRFQVTLGIGGNIGDTCRIFEKLLVLFQRSKFVDLVATAPILKNPAFGYKDQNDFYNSIIVVKTNLYPKSFLNYILRVEKRFRRKRLFKNAPRSLDLDIIFFDNFSIRTRDLTVPHPKWSERQSVTIPLRYLYGVENF